MCKFDGQNLIKCEFLEGRLPKYFFQEICSSSGKQTINKVSAAFIVKTAILRTESKSSWELSDSERNPGKHLENSIHRSLQSDIQRKAAKTIEFKIPTPTPTSKCISLFSS